MSCHKNFSPTIGRNALIKKAEGKRHEYETNPKKCEHCGEPISYPDHKRKIFCSRSCAITFNNLKRGCKLNGKYSRNKEYNGKIFKFPVCVYCGSQIKSRRYCSKECQRDYVRGKIIERWLRGEIISTEEAVPSAIRFFLLKESNYKCSLCGWGETNPTTNKIPIAVDHIDGNSRNNSRENLRVLCPNCHSLTSTYGSLNKGNGRKKRYKFQNDSIV